MSFIEFSGIGESSGFGAFGVLTATEIYGGVIGGFLLETVSLGDAEASSSVVSLELLLPPAAVVTRAVVRVTAEAPGTTHIGGIAAVRAAAGSPDASSDLLVVDFGTLRTVSALEAPAAVESLQPWVGTTFSDGVELTSSVLGTAVEFTELQTERLLVQLAANTLPATFATDGKVTTTTPPADLEVTVGATRVWFRPGPAPAGFTEDVDVTSAVQGAVDAGGPPGPDGNLRVPLVLKARVPGELGLGLAEEPRFLRTLTIDFPGPSAAVRFTEEGEQALTLPLPAGSEMWTIHRVVATVDATDPGPLRVLPPVGPARSSQAELMLDPDRRLVAKLPAGPLGRLEAVAGVRVSLQPDAGGIEVGGALLGGTATEPGEPLPDATFTPVNLPAATAPAWVTLATARPVELPVDETPWASLSVTRGRAVLGLADAVAVPSSEIAELRRIAPNGIAHLPSTAVLPRDDTALPAVSVRTDALALRVTGRAPENAPVALAEVDLAGGGTVREPAGPGAIAISLEPAGTRSPLELVVTTTAATTVTVGPVLVAYTEPANGETADHETGLPS